MPNAQVVERIEHDPNSLYFQEHLARYRFACERILPGLTLDMACGTGYGSSLLSAQTGTWVVGVDLDSDTLATAQRTYGATKVAFLEANGGRLSFGDGCFRNVVSMETVEHLKDDRGFVRELGRVLSPDGTCILSTPNRAYTLRNEIANPFHVREYFEDELRALLSAQFSDVQLFYQGFSAAFNMQAHAYSTSVQFAKEQLNPVVKIGLNGFYRPIKRFLPKRTINIAIQKLLKIHYPKPTVHDISITRERNPDASVFIAVCREPRG